MSTLHSTSLVIRQEVVKIISSFKKLSPERVSSVNDFTLLHFDILDVVEIILKLEKKFNIIIPDEVPVYSVDDLVNHISSYNMKQAG